MTFTKTIRQLRDKAGASQADVAEAIGVARATYASLEAGRREPNLAELKKLSRFYEISISELINENQTIVIEEPTIKYRRESQKVDLSPREIDPTIKPDKLREVLLYVLNKVGAKPNIGETALYKLLYFIDMDYYEKNERSITGLTYIHNTYGPSPVSDFRAVVEDMKQHDELEVIETKYFKNNQKKYLPRIVPNLDKLSASEVKHIDETLMRLGDKNASELSDLAHKDTPWIVAKQGKPIDYRDVFYRTPLTAVTEPTDEL